MRNKYNSIYLFLHYAFISLVGVILSFLLTATIVGTPLHASLKVKNINEPFLQHSGIFMSAFNSMNEYFYDKEMNGELKPVYTLGFHALTNLNLTDSRTFLGRELPGLLNYDTEIAIAGEGTNESTLPIESSAPVEEFLKDTQIADGELQKQKDPQQEQNDTLPRTTNGKKVVYIYHTHSWESFLPLLKGVTSADEAVSPNNKVNVVAVGQMLADSLMDKGIGVEHSTANIAKELQSQHKNYYQAYEMSRVNVREAVATNSNLKVLIDIHRDSQPRKFTTTTINGKPYARLFFVIGKENKGYQKNLQFSKELNAKLEAKYPGISRGVLVKGKSQGNGVYNQDFSSEAMLLEFGGYQNNLAELQNTIKAFSEVFSEFYWRAQEVNG